MAIPPPSLRLDFLELHRLGVGGWQPVAAGILRLVVYFYGGMYLLTYAIAVLTVLIAPQLQGTVSHRDALVGLGWLGKPAYLLSLSLLGALAVWHTLHYSDRRPFLSVIAPDLRFDWRRMARGCGLYMLSLLAFVVVLLPFDDALPIFTPSWRFLIFLPVALVLVPLQSAAEEIVFRGYLAQVFRKLTPNPLIVSMFVAILFAALHGSIAGPLSFPFYVVMSLVFSYVTLRDQRLELAMGAHTGNNLVHLLLFQRADSPVSTPALFLCEGGDLGLTEILAMAGIGALFAYLALGPRRTAAAASARL